MKTSLTALAAACLVVLTFQVRADEPVSIEDKPLTETHWDKVLLAKKRLDAAINVDKWIEMQVKLATKRRELVEAKGLMGKKLTPEQVKDINADLAQYAGTIVENKTPECKAAFVKFLAEHGPFGLKKARTMKIISIGMRKIISNLAEAQKDGDLEDKTLTDFIEDTVNMIYGKLPSEDKAPSRASITKESLQATAEGMMKFLSKPLPPMASKCLNIDMGTDMEANQTLRDTFKVYVNDLANGEEDSADEQPPMEAPKDAPAANSSAASS